MRVRCACVPVRQGGPAGRVHGLQSKPLMRACRSLSCPHTLRYLTFTQWEEDDVKRELDRYVRACVLLFKSLQKVV